MIDIIVDSKDIEKLKAIADNLSVNINSKQLLDIMEMEAMLRILR
jgi:hypothetical protein